MRTNVTYARLQPLIDLLKVHASDSAICILPPAHRRWVLLSPSRSPVNGDVPALLPLAPLPGRLWRPAQGSSVD